MNFGKILFSLLLWSIGTAHYCCADPASLTSEQEKGILEEEEKAVLLDDRLDAVSSQEYHSLEECIDLAEKRNFDVRRAREELRRGLGIKQEGMSRLLPEVLASGQYENRDPDSLSSLDGRTFGTSENWSAIAEIQQPLFLGGEGVSAWNRGDLMKRAATKGYQAVLNEVRFSVRKKFYDTLLARAQIAVQRQSVDLLRKQLVLTKNRFDAGTVPRFSVLRAEVELANAETPLIRSRNNLRLALEELSQVLGMVHKDPAQVEAAIRIKGSLTYHEPEFDLPGAIEMAMKSRPEIAQLRFLHKAELEGVDIERANYFPHLLAFAGYGWESSRFSDGLSDVDQGWRFGVRAEWSLFDGLRTQGRVKQALASAGSARVRLREKVSDVTVEVRRALSDLLEAQQLVRASRKVVEQAEEGLRQAIARLDSGSGPQIDVLDTQVALTEARTNSVVARHAFHIARAEVRRATGTS